MEQAIARKKRPLGFYVCAISFTFERMGYYAVKYLLVIFAAGAIAEGGLGIAAGDAAILSSVFVASTYLAPIFGGIISDRWIGARYCVPVGMFLMGAGYIAGSKATDLSLLYVMIALVAVGTGLFKGNVSAINGRLFDDPDELDAAFSIQYSFVNIGSFIGTTAVGVLYLKTFAKDGILGFAPCFMLAGIIMIIGGIWFLLGTRFLGEAGKKPFKVAKDDEGKAEADKEPAKPLTTIEKKRVAAIILVSIFSIVFWLFWYLAYMPIYFHWADNAQWVINGFQVPTSWFDSLNGLCCIILGPTLAMLWLKLSKRPQGDMSIFKKTGIGLALLGGAYLVFALAEATRTEGTKVSLLWFVAFGILLSLGEMFFSPLGNSFISKYAPAKLLGVMMGVWTSATFVATLSYGFLFKATENFDFVTVQVVIAVIAFISAVVLFVLNKSLSKLVEDKE